ncbi:MAG TPA: hypothetical protein VN446_03375 [Candidatus Acidoferrum sp.]|nr:hypothetical protein [Candidatus Acidoferrum sp.]
MSEGSVRLLNEDGSLRYTRAVDDRWPDMPVRRCRRQFGAGPDGLLPPEQYGLLREDFSLLLPMEYDLVQRARPLTPGSAQRAQWVPGLFHVRDGVVWRSLLYADGEVSWFEPEPSAVPPVLVTLGRWPVYMDEAAQTPTEAWLPSLIGTEVRFYRMGGGQAVGRALLEAGDTEYDGELLVRPDRSDTVGVCGAVQSVPMTEAEPLPEQYALLAGYRRAHGIPDDAAQQCVIYTGGGRTLFSLAHTWTEPEGGRTATCWGVMSDSGAELAYYHSKYTAPYTRLEAAPVWTGRLADGALLHVFMLDRARYALVDDGSGSFTGGCVGGGG